MVSSVRFDNSADFYSRAVTGLPSSDVTMACWVYLVVDRNAPSYYLETDNAADRWHGLGTTSDGTTIRFVTESGAGAGDTSGISMSTSTWYYVASVYSTSGTDTLYYAAAGAGSLSSNTGAHGGVVSASTLYIGTTGFTQPWNGRVAQVKIWTAALSQAELEAEMVADSVVRTSGIWAYYSFRSGPQTNDESGNSRTLTANGTLTTEAGPPVSGGGTSGTATPAVIARTVTIPAATPQVSKTVTPAVTARSVTVPAATASGASTGTANPAVIARTVTLPTGTVQTGSTALPALIARLIILPAPTTSGETAATYNLAVGTNPITALYLGTVTIEPVDVHLGAT